MSQRNVELWLNGQMHLHLSNVLPAEGAPASGYVVNGDWYWRIDGNEEVAADGRGVEHSRRPRLVYDVVELADSPARDALDRLLDEDVAF